MEIECTDGEARTQKSRLFTQVWVDIKELVSGVFIVGTLPKPKYTVPINTKSK